MTEAGRLKINASHLQRLSLGFVDGHGKAQLDRELYPLECKCQVAWDDRNTGDEHILTLGASCYDGRLKKVWHEALHQESSTILHSLGASRFRSSMMGAPTFRSRWLGGVPGGSSELRNSAGKSTSWLSPHALSMDLYEDALPGSCFSSCKLMFVATSFFGASIARSHIHCGYSTSLNRWARFGKTFGF